MKKVIKKGISVIIPTYNRAEYLYSTLICLCHQNEILCDYEIIVIDSGDDDTESIIRSIKQSFNSIITYKKIRNCHNRSVIRNEGAKQAQYDIICFLDNDILVPPTFINRHFQEHQEEENLILMHCRRSLTSFDINQIGEEFLINDFRLLEKLPWYKDERLDIYEDKNQWRFVFSHTLSMNKNIFFKIGKFNEKFGEHWGFEDLELGFNLMQAGCHFKLISDSFVYHQPHFLQSKKEQNETRFNKDLFLTLHNCYEVELYSAFYIDYDCFLRDIQSQKENYLLYQGKKTEELNFDKILGCIVSYKDNSVSSKLQLGVYIPLSDKTCKKVLILPTFFSFQQLLQYSILSEAFRVSKNIYFRFLSEENKKILIKIAKECGLEIELVKEKKYMKCLLKQRCYSKFYAMTLPEIYCPEKRYVYSWLLKELKNLDKELIISDFHNVKTLKNDDLRLSDVSSQLLDKCFKNYLGLEKFQVINSTSILNSHGKINIGNNKDNIIFHDDDFYNNYESLKYRGIRNCKHYSEKSFADLTLASVYEILKKNPVNMPSEITSSITFMENGFYEDGIDLVLSFIAKMKEEKPEIKLVIKLPNYNELFKHCLPFHNGSSKFNKIFLAYQKYNFDMTELKRYLAKFNLNKNVILISENLTMKDVGEIIQNNETVLFLSRGIYIPPQIYIAIFLGKKVVLGEHHIIQKELEKYVLKIESEKYNFADELKVPISCMNSVYSAFRCNTEKLLYLMDNPKFIDKKNIVSIYEKIYSRVKSAFVES